MSDVSFRAQSTPRRAWSLNPNSLEGLDTAVNNNQNQLAIEYLAILVKEMKADIENLKVQMAGVRATATVPKAAPRTKADPE